MMYRLICLFMLSCTVSMHASAAALTTKAGQQKIGGAVVADGTDYCTNLEDTLKKKHEEAVELMKEDKDITNVCNILNQLLGAYFDYACANEACRDDILACPEAISNAATIVDIWCSAVL